MQLLYHNFKFFFFKDLIKFDINFMFKTVKNPDSLSVFFTVSDLQPAANAPFIAGKLIAKGILHHLFLERNIPPVCQREIGQWKDKA